MITYEQDPDFVRWGLQLFDGDPYSNCGYCGAIIQNNTECYNEHYFKEHHYSTECSNQENNELIVNALQESFSQLSVTQPASTFQQGFDHTQTPFYQQDWYTLSTEDYACGNELTEFRPSSSCSTPGEDSFTTEDWQYPVELLDGYSLDELEKRLNQMIPVPHIPRINGEIPSVDEATLDHQRLLDRLQVYELVECKVRGDGNCQFRALSHQFYRTPEHHRFVRRQVVNQLRSHPDVYEAYVPMAYDEYLRKMSKSGEWGDHVTLQAAADSYGVKIFVITSFKETCYIEIVPSVQKSERVIFLSFWAEVHYNSIFPEGEAPRIETKKKKRWLTNQDLHLDIQDDYN